MVRSLIFIVYYKNETSNYNIKFIVSDLIQFELPLLNILLFYTKTMELNSSNLVKFNINIDLTAYNNYYY